MCGQNAQFRIVRADSAYQQSTFNSFPERRDKWYLLGNGSGPKFVSFYLWQNMRHLSILVLCLLYSRSVRVRKDFS